jgi:hypothetical protein
VLIVVGYIVRFALAWPELAAKDPASTATEQAVVLGIVLSAAIAFLVPAIVVNLRFAQARHLTGRQANGT